MVLTVYGIKSCDTCRKARKYLDDRKIEHTFHDIRDDGLNIQMLERWSGRISWETLLNKQSLTWRKIAVSNLGQSTKIYDRATGEVTYGYVPPGSVVVAGNLPSADGKYSLYCAVIVKHVDAKTRAKTGLNELLRNAE